MFKKIIICLFPFLSIGCASIQLWEPDTYNENISEYYLAQDGSTLVVIGRKHHYIFSEPKGLAQILGSEHSGNIHAEFGKSFKVSKENNISGNFKVVCDCLFASEDLLNFVEKNNFQSTVSNDSCGIKTQKHFKEFELSGIRYSAEEQRPDSSTSFNRDYEVVVELEASASETIGNIIQTPLAAAIDTVNTTGIIALSVAFSPFIIMKLATEKVVKDSNVKNCNSQP